MKHPYGEQYSQEGNPRSYMTMRDYRNLPYQWGNQQPVERNPSEYRSMRDYRDHWMSAPSYMVPPQYAPPEPPCYAPTSQQQQPPPLSPLVEQAILDLTRIVDDFVEENKKINAHSIVTVEDNLNKKIDGLTDDFEHKWDNLQDSIEDLNDQHLDHPEEESQEEECLSDTMVEDSCLQQPQEILVENFESSVGAVVCLWEKKDAIPLLLTEESVEEHKENNLPLPPTDSVYILPLPAPQSQPKTPTANAQATYNPLPVYILPAANSKPTTPAPKGKSNPSLHVMQNLKILVAYVHKFATTSKAHAAAYMAWHSGWFGCGFRFETPGPRHF